MSAAHWRKAMNSRRPAASWPGAARRRPRLGAAATAAGARRSAPTWLRGAGGTSALRHVFVLAAVLVYPWVAPPFFTFQIGAQSLVLGLIALSLTFLGGYGGMVSLAQMTVAGIAGYIGRDPRHQRHAGDQPGLAVVAGGRARRSLVAARSPPRSSAGSRCAPRASTRS